MEITYPPLPTAKLAIALAYEGVPIRAIARATKIPSDELRDLITDAIDAGDLLKRPREDWDRAETLVPAKVEPTSRIGAMMHLYKLTRQEAAAVHYISAHTTASRDSVHAAMCRSAGPHSEGTVPKIVDVIMSRSRKKLRPFNIAIKTIFNEGFYMEPDHKRALTAAIDTFLGDNSNAQ